MREKVWGCREDKGRWGGVKKCGGQVWESVGLWSECGKV